MDQNTGIVSAIPSSLEVANMDIAHQKYANFVNINNEELTQAQFKEALNLPLNEKVASAFFQKTAHLGDNDFIKIDREMLQTIGFTNTFKEKRDSEGNLKLDANGNPHLEDKRQDFNNAIKCLRNTKGFIEGKSLHDIDAHFVLEKVAHLPGRASHGGQNRQELWIRMRALEHFIIMTNTQNSFMVREYFLDLKRIMMEYNMYLAVYRSKRELNSKECKITCLVEDMKSQREQMNELIMRSERTESKMDRVMDTMTRIEDKVVLPAQNPKVKELMVIMHFLRRSHLVHCVENSDETQERSNQAVQET